MNKSVLSIKNFNMKLQYDLNKLVINDNSHKLTWLFFINDHHNENDINYVLNNFLNQINQNDIKLLYIINENSELINTINYIIQTYSNISLLKLTNNFLNIKNKSVIRNIDTNYITMVNSETKIFDSFSVKAIQYMDNTVNCDVGISSFIKKNKKN